jgi:endonuclease/exonuclease/phosphatase family metal-dependent hydrolase
MRIASYNIRKAVGLDWRRDPDRIIDVLTEIDADIVVLQEVDRRVGARGGVLSLDRLERELGYALPDVSVRTHSHGWHGNAILVRNGLETGAMQRIELPTVEPRGAVSVCLVNPELEIVGVHLGLTPGMRRKQMLALQQVIRDRRHPVILAGDFNEWNDKRLPFQHDLQILSPGPTFHASRPTARLDRFVLTQELTISSCRVHHSELALRASDHLPIVLDLEVRKART